MGVANQSTLSGWFTSELHDAMRDYQDKTCGRFRQALAHLWAAETEFAANSGDILAHPTMRTPKVLKCSMYPSIYILMCTDEW